MIILKIRILNRIILSEESSEGIGSEVGAEESDFRWCDSEGSGFEAEYEHHDELVDLKKPAVIVAG